MGERWHNRPHAQVHSSKGEMLSSFPPSGSAPTLPTSHHRWETQLRSRSGGPHSKNSGADSATDRTVSTTEQREDATRYPEQRSGHRNTSQAAYHVSDFSGCGLCGHTHVGVAPDHSLSCLHSSHRGSRRVVTVSPLHTNLHVENFRRCDYVFTCPITLG